MSIEGCARSTYSELLDIFWRSHAPEHRSWSGQYKSIIFYNSEEERQMANESKREREAELNKTLYTEIKPYIDFYLAEDYHEKGHVAAGEGVDERVQSDVPRI